MLKVVEVVKSFLSATQKPKSNVNMQCVMQCKSNTHMLVFLVLKGKNQSLGSYTDDTDMLTLH